MSQDHDARAHPPSSTVRRSLCVALAFLVALSLALVSAPTARAIDPLTSAVTLDRESVEPGGTVEIDLQVTSTLPTDALVDLEIYSSSGSKIFQTWWDAQTLLPGTTGSYEATWHVPATQPAGVYTVVAGIFAPAWTVLYHWNHMAATITVQPGGLPAPAPAPATPEVPPTTAPPASAPSAPVTTVGATNTTAAPVTTAASRPAMFSEDFATAAGVGRFDWQLHSGANGGPCGTGNNGCGLIDATDRAEHDMSCGAPTTHRHIDPQPVHDYLVLDPATSPLMYHCAPGSDAAKGHVMTIVETTGVLSLSFSPKQVFTDINKLCFDINTNNNMGAGKWINAWIVPTWSLAANGGRFDFADEPGLDPEQEVPGPEDWHMKYFDGSLISSSGLNWWEWNRRASESATRFTQCVEQTGPNQLTYTRDFPADTNGDGVMDPGVATTETQTGPGTLPDGPVRVIFQDGSYNPDKHGGNGGVTWHWDNITIS